MFIASNSPRRITSPTFIHWKTTRRQNKCLAVTGMGDRLATIDMGRKLGAVPRFFLGGGARSPYNTMWPEPRPTFVPSGILIHPAVCMPTTDIDQKLRGELCPLGVELGLHLTQRCPGRGLSSYQVASWSIQLFGHKRHGTKIGGCAPFLGRGEMDPHLTQCILGRGLPS